MSSARIIARTYSWLRRRSRWLLLLLFTFVVSLLLIERQSIQQFSWQWSQLARINTLILPDLLKTNHRNATTNKDEDAGAIEDRLRGKPRLSAEVCRQDNPFEIRADFDLHDLYGNLVGRDGKTLEQPAARNATTEKLRVFILPFTHVDPGWLKTFEKYTKETNSILDNMHSFMKENKEMRFMWAEFVFFERWWSLQSEEVRNDVRELVKSGRLEFASGSWVMTDEANVYFPVSVDNIVEGHHFLQREFGSLPRVVFSNDPFGYSNSIPYLFTQAGLTRTVINRIHHTLKQHLQRKRAIPFRWRQYFDDKAEMLTQVLPYSHYDILNSCGPNPGICCQFDFKRMTHWSCPGPKPEAISEQNVKEKAVLLVSQLKEMAKMYEAPVMLMMHGDDFRFDMIEEWHQHHDNFLPLFKEINKGDDVEISFGTYTDYFNSLEKWYESSGESPPTVTGDFFPYMCALGDYWTGYFTTRPFYKKQGRQTHNLIRTADLLSSEAIGQRKMEAESVYERLTQARRILSLFQHHDAITGTSKIPVMADYSNLLHNASSLARSVIEDTLKVLGEAQSVKVIEYAVDANSNIESELLSVGEGVEIKVEVYNSLPYIRHSLISLLVSTADSEVKEGDYAIEAQIDPALKDGVIRNDAYKLSFRSQLPPLGSKSFVIRYKRKPSTTHIAKLKTTKAHVDNVKSRLPSIFPLESTDQTVVVLENSPVKMAVNSSSGMIETFTSSIGFIPLSTVLSEYTGSSGGAYILRSQGEPKPFDVSNSSTLFISGPLESTAHTFSTHFTHSASIRELPGSLAEQIHVAVRVDLTKVRNTEMVWRLKTKKSGTTTNTTSAFFVDSVGLQMLRRESYSALTQAANYYPMASAAFLQDSAKRITVLTDVEHGATRTGEMGMEIMLDRMMNQDDGKGLGNLEEGIPTDLKPVLMHFTILVEQAKTTVPAHHSYNSLASTIALQSLLYPPLPYTVAGSNGLDRSKIEFPCEMQLLTTRLASKSSILVVLFHNGVDCTITSSLTCSDAQLKASLIPLLSSLGASSNIRSTALNGVTVLQTFSSLSDLSSLLLPPSPQKFVSLVFDV